MSLFFAVVRSFTVSQLWSILELCSTVSRGEEIGCVEDLCVEGGFMAAAAPQKEMA